MSIAISHQAIRAKLMNPPIRITREAFEEEKAKRAAVTNTLKTIERSAAEKQRRIVDLEAKLKTQEVRIEELTRHIADLVVADESSLSVLHRPISVIIREVLEKWPGVSWAQVRGCRRAQHIVGARHHCIQAVAKQRPDLSSVAISRVFKMDHSSILYAIKKGHQAEVGK